MARMLALVTCRELPEPDVDERPLVDALASRDVDVRVLAWDDPDADWGATSMQVIRSSWNYHRHLDRFLRWGMHVGRGGTMWNPPAIVGWNCHKRYLLEIAARGVPVVPTVVVAAGSDAAVGRIREATGWDRLVIKPAVSAGSYATIVAGPGDDDRVDRHLAEHLPVRELLVQPFVGDVEGRGERALVWIDGEITHAVRKATRFEGDAERVSVEPVTIEPDELRLAQRLLDALGVQLLYARVDIVRDRMGDPMLMELELIEPSLFLAQHPPALERFADAIARRFRAATGRRLL